MFILEKFHFHLSGFFFEGTPKRTLFLICQLYGDIDAIIDAEDILLSVDVDKIKDVRTNCDERLENWGWRLRLLHHSNN
jgi:hypothetical protein